MTSPQEGTTPSLCLKSLFAWKVLHDWVCLERLQLLHYCSNGLPAAEEHREGRTMHGQVATSSIDVHSNDGR